MKMHVIAPPPNRLDGTFTPLLNRPSSPNPSTSSDHEYAPLYQRRNSTSSNIHDPYCRDSPRPTSPDPGTRPSTTGSEPSPSTSRRGSTSSENTFL